MNNPITIYADAGHRAGLAARHKDMATLRHWNEWTNRAIAMEPADARKEAREAYNDAYRAAATRAPNPLP